jgi:hypothetical protein
MGCRPIHFPLVVTSRQEAIDVLRQKGGIRADYVGVGTLIVEPYELMDLHGLEIHRFRWRLTSRWVPGEHPEADLRQLILHALPILALRSILRPSSDERNAFQLRTSGSCIGIDRSTPQRGIWRGWRDKWMTGGGMSLVVSSTRAVPLMNGSPICAAAPALGAGTVRPTALALALIRIKPNSVVNGEWRGLPVAYTCRSGPTKDSVVTPWYRVLGIAKEIGFTRMTAPERDHEIMFAAQAAVDEWFHSIHRTTFQRTICATSDNLYQRAQLSRAERPPFALVASLIRTGRGHATANPAPLLMALLQASAPKQHRLLCQSLSDERSSSR